MSVIKRIPAIFCAVVMIFSLTACEKGTNITSSDSASSADSTVSSDASASESAAETEVSSSAQTDAAEPSSTSEESAEPSSPDKKSSVLVAYFSCTGNTKNLAEYAAEVTGGTLYEIVPAVPYTDADLNWHDSDSRTSKEMNDSACRPEISGTVDNFNDYDIVFIAYPIWWGEAPRIISTFVESYNFSGKTVVPFCTSGSSPIGSSAKNLHSLTNGAEWLDGARHSSSMTKDEMAEWISGLGLDIQSIL